MSLTFKNIGLNFFCSVHTCKRAHEYIYCTSAHDENLLSISKPLGHMSSGTVLVVFVDWSKPANMQFQAHYILCVLYKILVLSINCEFSFN